jgi:hypothetical protein
MKNLATSCLAVGISLLSSVAFCKESAFAVRATDVKDQPFSDARTVSTLPESAKIEVLTRKGSWTQINAPAGTGWVKMLSLRFESQSQAAGNDNSTLKSVYNLATTGSSGSTVTTATRSLDEKKFGKTVANPQALASMRTFAVSKTDAQQFAKLEKLGEQELAYISSNGGKP